MDIGKIVEVIQKKVLKGTHFPMEVKQIQAGYLNSQISKIYICICHKICSHLQNQQSENKKH